MKKVVTLFILLSIFIESKAQIPNKNFETWSNGTENAPNGWHDQGSPFLGFHPVSQTTDKYLGNFAAKIETKISGSDTARGVMSTTRPMNKEGFGAAFPVSQRYLNLKGYYKYFPQNGDSAMIIVFLTKTGFVGQWGNMLGWGSAALGTASTYTPFSIGYNSSSNFVYMGTEVPDSGFIEISSYKSVTETSGNLKPRGNSLLFVDAINFDSYFTSSINEQIDITCGFKLFPNFITNGNFNIEFETKTSDYTSIRIFDLNGKQIKNLYEGNLNSGFHSFKYDVSELKSGNYLFLISSPNGYKAEQICISDN